MGRVANYVTTARHLQPRQIYHRARLLLWQKLVPRPLAAALTPGRGPRHAAVEPLAFGPPKTVPIVVKDLAAGDFTFLNRRVSLGQPVQWLPQGEERLWIYNLHYFHYALTLAVERAKGESYSLYELFRSLVNQWIDRVPVGTSRAWDAYPTSLRIANWIKAYSFLRDDLADDAEFAQRLERSLYSQAAYLESRVEYDLLNNHVLENGRALWLAGLFFPNDARAKRWHDQGLKILMDGLRDHFLADGAHDELSPMYHQIMFELYDDMADVLAGRGEPVPPELTSRLGDMRCWLSAVVHPDGQIALLNDAAHHIAPDPVESLGREIEPPAGLQALPQSGIFAFRDRRKLNYLVFDCGSLGPDHQPAHGHCDALSYELSIGGRRMIVDSGVETYHGDLKWRAYYRGTRAHNTLVVDGAEQSEIWHRFRVARRAKPLSMHWNESRDGLAYAMGGHDGYRRLASPVDHERCVCWVDRRFWVILDRLVGVGTHHVENLIHFHPEVQVVSVPNELRPFGEVRRSASVLRIAPFGATTFSALRGATEPIQGWYASEFGRRDANDVWSFAGDCGTPGWAGYVLWPEDSDIDVQFTPIYAELARLRIRTSETRYELHFTPQAVRREK